MINIIISVLFFFVLLKIINGTKNSTQYLYWCWTLLCLHHFLEIPNAPTSSGDYSAQTNFVVRRRNWSHLASLLHTPTHSSSAKDVRMTKRLITCPIWSVTKIFLPQININLVAHLLFSVTGQNNLKFGSLQNEQDHSESADHHQGM